MNSVAPNPDFSPDCVTGGGGALRLGLVGPARPPGGLGTRRFVLLDGSNGPAGGGGGRGGGGGWVGVVVFVSSLCGGGGGGGGRAMGGGKGGGHGDRHPPH